MKININAKSIKGKNHEINQDYFDFFLNKNKNGLLAIADGVGSYQLSNLASKELISLLIKEFKKINFNNLSSEDIKNWGKNLIEKKFLYQLQKYSEKVATTLTFIIIVFNKGYIFHIGNTRVYFFDKNNENFWQITKDHNFIDNDSLAWLKGKKMLKNSLSNFNTCYFDFEIIDLKPGYLLFTTDGLHDFLNYKFLHNTLKNHNLNDKNKLEFLIDKALFYGSIDDISCLLIKIDL